jgi:hypothetical protein
VSSTGVNAPGSRGMVFNGAVSIVPTGMRICVVPRRANVQPAYV